MLWFSFGLGCNWPKETLECKGCMLGINVGIHRDFLKGIESARLDQDEEPRP